MDDSDKAGADFASKPNGAWAAAIGQTAYRDGFMPASLGINYTPCQAADARSSDQRWPRLRTAPIVTAVLFPRDGSRKEKERQEKDVRAARRKRETKEKSFPSSRYKCLLRDLSSWFTPRLNRIERHAAACTRTKMRVVISRSPFAIMFDDFVGNATRRKRCVT